MKTIRILSVAAILALIVAACGGGKSAEALGEECSGADAQSPGEDDSCDRLVEMCSDGDGEACDFLWLRSGVGGDLEAYGATCGGRDETREAYGECADLLGDGGDLADVAATPIGDFAEGGEADTDATDESGDDDGADAVEIDVPITDGERQDASGECVLDFSATARGDNAGCDLLADTCEAGDMVSCDTLGVGSNVGSEYSIVAITCGGRQDDDGAAELNECEQAFGAVASDASGAASEALESAPEGDAAEQSGGADELPDDATAETGSASSVDADAAWVEMARARADLSSLCLGGETQACDTLLETCNSGADFIACNELYFDTEGDSAYGIAGATCGGRVTVGDTGAEGACQLLIDHVAGCAASDASDPGADPDCDLLVQTCNDGDLDACNHLYYVSPIDSELERLGARCGDRVGITADEAEGFCDELVVS